MLEGRADELAGYAAASDRLGHPGVFDHHPPALQRVDQFRHLAVLLDQEAQLIGLVADLGAGSFGGPRCSRRWAAFIFPSAMQARVMATCICIDTGLSFSHVKGSSQVPHGYTAAATEGFAGRLEPGRGIPPRRSLPDGRRGAGGNLRMPAA